MEALAETLDKNAGEAKGKLDEKTGEYVGKLDYDSDIGRYNLNFSETISLIVENDGTIITPQILRAQKVLMAQSGKSDVLTSFGNEHQEHLTTDVHSHYTAMLEPDKLFALGLKHNVNYHAYYMYALGLDLSQKQKDMLVANIINVSKKNKEKGFSQEEISEEIAKKILEELEQNKGNVKKISEILDTHKIKKNLSLNFTTLVFDSPQSKSKENIEKILKSCSLSTEEQSTFTDMLDVYGFRFPFTNGSGNRKKIGDISEEIRKSTDIPDSVKQIFEQVSKDTQNSDFEQNDLQEDTILMIYRQAKSQGLSYIEMSHNALASNKQMEVIQTYEKIFPKIGEGEPQLRFLAGISRTINEKKGKETFEYVKDSLKSKYVAGIDFLGEEFNSTSDFEGLLGDITQYALDEDPDMVIRVHAGETNSFDGNIEKVFEVVYGKYLEKIEKYEKEKKDISQIKKPNLRIGHGIYGLEKGRNITEDSKLGKIWSELREKGLLKDEKEEISLLSFASQMDVVIERNITSNILLSHKSGLKEDVMKAYLDNGVKCVLGTDGYGVYGTTIEEEQVLAGVLGLDDDYISKMKETEKYIQQRSQTREEYISKRDFEVQKDGKKDGKNEREIKAEEDEKKIPFILTLSSDKKNIVIAGGSFNGYDKDGVYKDTVFEPEEEKNAEEMITSIMNLSNPEENRFIIGGKLQGYERKIIELNQKRVREGKTGFEIVVVTNEDLSKVSEKNAELFKDSNINFMKAPEKDLASYKKINEEVFSEDNPSVLLVFDGQQATANLIADANKGKNNRIFIKDNINEFILEKANLMKNVKKFSMSFGDIKSFAKEDGVQDINSEISSLVGQLSSRSLEVDKDEKDNGDK